MIIAVILGSLSAAILHANWFSGSGFAHMLPNAGPTATNTATATPVCTPVITVMNVAPITLNDCDIFCGSPEPASPYPSTINVTGLTGTITKVTAKLKNFTHTNPDDVDIVLVGPQGHNATIMSDVGGGFDVSGITLTLDDSAAGGLPDAGQLTTGTFQPTNIGTGDTFPSAPSSGVPFFSVFNGTNPNGLWRLYIVDDATVDSGTMSGGWELTITTNCVPTPTATATATATATFTPTPTALSITPSSHDYGSVAAGSNSTPFTFTVHNNGVITVSGIEYFISGTDSASFAIMNNNCGPTLSAATVCTLDVRFNPATTGSKMATLNAMSGSGGSPTASLTGLGIMATATNTPTSTPTATPAVSITPGMHDYGSVGVGTNSATFTFTVQNNGGSAVTMAISISGTDPTSFSRDATVSMNCGATLNAGATCNLGVRFNPATPGAKSAVLNVTSGTSAALTGTGTASTPTNTATNTPTTTPTTIPSATPTATQTPPLVCGMGSDTGYPITVNGEALATVGSNLYSFGGQSSGTVIGTSYKYDGSVWTPIASLPQSRAFAAAVSDGTNIFILGGSLGATGETNVWRYNVATDNYTTLAPFSVASWGHGAVLYNGKIYKFAGTGPEFDSTNAHEVYDIASNTWTPRASYPAATSWLGAFGQGNFIYGAGGTVAGSPQSKTYRYDPVSDTWDDATIADLPATRWGAASAAYAGSGVLIGGYVNGTSVTNISFSGIIWDYSSNSWVSLPSLPSPRGRMRAAARAQFLHIVGGISNAGAESNSNFRLNCNPAPTATTTATLTATATPTNTATNTPATTPTNTPTATATGTPCGPGTLDASFNGTGIVTTPLGSGDDGARSVAVMPDGRIVVAGNGISGTRGVFAIARYNPNGSLDISLNGNGRVLAPIGTSDAGATAMTLQPDGKIIAAGFASEATTDFAVARFNLDGQLDGTFNGTGTVLTPVRFGNDIPFAVALQPDGKIIVAGSSSNGFDVDFAIVRYNANGSLDTSFNGTGKVFTAFGSANDQAYSVALQSDGKIVAAGFSFVGSSNDFAVARYNTDGSLDTSFNGTGKVTTPVGPLADAANALAIQSDGKIVAVGQSDNGSNFDFGLVRYNADGTLDTGFNGTGIVITPVGTSLGLCLCGSTAARWPHTCRRLRLRRQGWRCRTRSIQHQRNTG